MLGHLRDHRTARWGRLASGFSVLLVLMVGLSLAAGALLAIPSARASPAPQATFNPPCAPVATGVCVSIASPGEPQIVPVEPDFVSSVEPNTTQSLPLYVKSASPLNWSQAPYSGPDSPVTLNVTATTWNGDPFYSLYDNSVYHSSSLSYWSGPTYVATNRSYPWWYEVNISALSQTGTPNFSPGMNVTWWIEITYNTSGVISHHNGPMFEFTYAGAWPYSPYTGASKYAGPGAFADDVTAVVTPTAPNWNDSVAVAVSTTAATVAGRAAIDQGYLNLTERAPSGVLVAATTFLMPPSVSGPVAATTFVIPATLAQVAGARVTYELDLADNASDWITSGLLAYTVNGNGSFLSDDFSDVLSLSASPFVGPVPANASLPTVGPGVPVELALESQDPSTAIAGAQVDYTVSLPLLGEVASQTARFDRVTSTDFTGAIPGLPVGAWVNFTIEAFDFSQHRVVSAPLEYTVPAFSAVVPTNATFFYVEVRDANAAGGWVSGARVEISSVSGYFRSVSTTVLGLAYPNTTGNPLAPGLAPAGATFTVNVSDPTFVPAGAHAPVAVQVVFVAPHTLTDHAVLVAASYYTIVESGDAVVFWLNGTSLGPLASLPATASWEIAGALGLVAFHGTVYEIGAVTIPIMVGNVGVLIAMSNIIVLSVDPKTMGVQTGMNQTFRNLGSAIGPVLVTSILASYAFTEFTPFGPFENYRLVGYEIVFGVVAAMGALGGLLSLTLRNFRFLADGTRHGAPSGAPAPGAEPAPAPAVSASRP